MSYHIELYDKDQILCVTARVRCSTQKNVGRSVSDELYFLFVLPVSGDVTRLKNTSSPRDHHAFPLMRIFIFYLTMLPLPVLVGGGCGAVLEHSVHLHRHHILITTQYRPIRAIKNVRMGRKGIC
jgi:hypothetical protein